MIPRAVQADAHGFVYMGTTMQCRQAGVLRAHTSRFRIAVFAVDDAFIAIKDHCPHADVSLSRGVLQDGILTCPAHSWQFSLATGQCTARGPSDCALRILPIELRNDNIFVKVRNSA